MNKKSKQILIVSSLLATGMIAVPVVSLATSVVTNKVANEVTRYVDEEYKYLYGDRYFNSYDDILAHVLSSNSKLISNDLYYGNINDAIFDQESKRINIAKMRKFSHNEPSRLSAAWLDALGRHTMDYEEAKRSFINEGLIRYKYIDKFGNMFPSYAEADASNKRATEFDELVYYELSDLHGKKFKINPLNKDDIDKVKEIALDFIIHKVPGSSPFGFKIMKQTNQSKSNNKVSLQEIKNKTILSKSIDTISNDIATITLNAIKEWILNYRVDVRVSLLNKNQHRSHDYYVEIQNKEDVSDYIQVVESQTNSGNKETNHRRDFIVKNIKLRNLDIFNSFLDTKNFYDDEWNSKYLEVRDYVKRESGYLKLELAREADVTFKSSLWDDQKENKKDIKIKILFNGTWGAANPGVDIDIMQDPNDIWDRQYPYLYFSTNVIKFEPSMDFSQNGFLSYVEQELNKLNDVSYQNDLKNIINNIVNDKNENDKNKNVFEVIFGQIQNENNDIFENMLKKYVKRDMEKGDQIGFHNLSSTLFNKTRRDGFEKYDVGPKSQIYKSFVKNLNQKDSYVYNYVLLNENLKNYRHFITYNNSPLFEFTLNNWDGNLNFNNEAEYEKYRKNSVLTNYLYLYRKDLSKNKMFNIRNISTIDWNVTGDVYEYSLNNNLPSYVTSINNEPNARKTFVIKNQSNYEPLSWQSSGSGHIEIIRNGVFGAINAYNNNIQKMSQQTYKKFENSNSVLDVEDVLVLKNSRNEFQEAIYSKILAQSDFSPSFFNQSLHLLGDLDRIAHNAFQEKAIKENFTRITPSKIVVVYDITGKIINPGISVDGIADTSNDALYDSEKNILDNLYRTTIIQKDTKMSYYRNDDGTFTLIDNTVNWVYTLKWKGTTNYFATYEDSTRYLKEMLKLDTIKVKI